MRARYTGRLFLIFCTLVTIMACCSCCPKITDGVTEPVTKTDTIYSVRKVPFNVYRPDTFSTTLRADSLQRTITDLISANINRTLSENSSGGVRTRIVYRDTTITAETNIDSLSVVIADSIAQIIQNTVVTHTKYVEKCPYGWPGWVHHLLVIAVTVLSFGLLYILIFKPKS